MRGMGKIKVCHMVTLLELGGAQQNTLFTVRHLDRSKFDVSLVCGEGAFLDDEARKIPNLKTHFVKNLVRPVHPFKDLACLFDLIALLRREKPDIVHTHSSKAGILGRMAARFAGTPVVIHSIHGFGFNPYQSFLSRSLYVWLEKAMARISHKLIAVSQENIDLGVSLNIGCRKDYVLIRSGVDVAAIRERAHKSDAGTLRAELGAASSSKVILNIGPFKLQKDPLSFIEFASKVAQRVPNAQFWMAGDGELRGAVEAKIAALNLKNKVKLLGWRRDIPELMNAADLHVLTSLWEGLPRSSLEALILSKPVVAFAVNGLNDIIRNGENGYILNPGDVSGLAERAADVLSNDALAKKLSDGASGTIDETFDINNMVRYQEELYENLTNKIPVVNIVT